MMTAAPAQRSVSVSVDAQTVIAATSGPQPPSAGASSSIITSATRHADGVTTRPVVIHKPLDGVMIDAIDRYMGHFACAIDNNNTFSPARFNSLCSNSVAADLRSKTVKDLVE